MMTPYEDAHARMQENVVLLAYAELVPEEVHATESHLASCGDCRALLEHVRESLLPLASPSAAQGAAVDAATPPSSHWSEALRREVAVETARERRRRFGRAVAAAAVFVAGILTGFALRFGAGTDSDGNHRDVSPGDVGPPMARPSNAVLPPDSSFARSAPPVPTTTRGSVAPWFATP